MRIPEIWMLTLKRKVHLMKKKHMFKGLGMMICFLVFTAGCASKPPVSGYGPTTKSLAGYKYSGFLSDYSKLRPDVNEKGAMIWRKPGVDFSKYDKVMVDRLMFVFKDDTEDKVIDATELKALADYFHEAFVKDLGKEYPVVNAPGPGVLRIRAAVTEIIPNKPEYSVVALVVPYLTFADMAATLDSKGGAGSSFYLGNTVIEAELMNSQTNEQLCAFVERYYPKKYDINLSNGVESAVTTGFGQYFKAYSTWDYTKEALNHWALMVRAGLDRAHGKTPQQ